MLWWGVDAFQFSIFKILKRYSSTCKKCSQVVPFLFFFFFFINPVYRLYNTFRLWQTHLVRTLYEVSSLHLFLGSPFLSSGSLTPCFFHFALPRQKLFFRYKIGLWATCHPELELQLRPKNLLICIPRSGARSLPRLPFCPPAFLSKTWAMVLLHICLPAFQLAIFFLVVLAIECLIS